MRFAPALAPVLAAAVLLPAAAFAAEGPTPLEQQWQLAAGRAVKIAVTADGWYRVPRASLLRAGLDRRAPAKSFRLFADGREVPIQVRAGGIEFFGVKRSVRTTDARTYWLTWGGKAGKRVGRAKGLVKLGRVARTFNGTVVDRPRNVYIGSLKAEGGPADQFFGPLVRPGVPATRTIAAPSIDPRGRPSLSVAFEGFGTAAHEVSVSVNATKVGGAAVNGERVGHVVARLPAGLVKPENNAVTVSTDGGARDFVFLWRVQLTYPRLFQAAGNRLRFRLPRGQAARVTGFTKPGIRLFNITTPTAPQVLPARVRRSGRISTLLVPASGRARQFLAVGAAAVLKPASVGAERPSAWHRAEQSADMVVISHPDFIPSLAPLIALRESEGLTVKVVDVRDVYDEFSFGVPSSGAIKAFLRRAYDGWRSRPRFVLLVGDASYDPKNYLGAGNKDYVPTEMIETSETHVPSDNVLADFDKDGVPEMAIGRLPVQTAAQASAVVHKLLSYEQQPGVAERPALFLADNDVVLEDVVDVMRSVLPASTAVELLFRRAASSRDAFKASLIAGLDAGPGIVSFVGHGGPGVWGADNFFGAGDMPRLTNADRLSLYLTTSCANAWFVDPRDEALGELFLEASNGGAVAMLASSGLETATAGLTRNRAVLQELVASPSRRFGETVVAAEKAAGGGELSRTAVLFGDPTLRLR